MRIRFLLPLIVLVLIPLSIRADQKPKLYPFHGKVTAAGSQKQTSTSAVVALGLPGLFVHDTHKTFTLTLTDGSTVTMEIGEYSREDKLLAMGDEVDFREDAKGEHAWIHFVRPNPKRADLPGKEAETKYNIIQVGAPPSAQLPSR